MAANKQLVKVLLKFIGIALFFAMPAIGFSQGVGINNSSSPADPSAMLDVYSVNQGLLIPRMTTTQRNLINSPAQSLLIYNITSKCFEFWENGFWQEYHCAVNIQPLIPTSAKSNINEELIIDYSEKSKPKN